MYCFKCYAYSLFLVLIAARCSARCVVQGVDLTQELQSAVRSLKLKLASLADDLEDITDHNELANCLTSMSTTIAVLQKIKNI